MFCMKCGQQLPESAKFCRKCGFKMPEMPVVDGENKTPIAPDVAPAAAAPVAPAAPAPAAPVAPAAHAVTESKVESTPVQFPSMDIQVNLQGITRDMTRATGDFDESHDLGVVSPQTLLGYLTKVAPLSPASEEDCPATLMASCANGEFTLMMEGGKIQDLESSASLSPKEAVALVVGNLDVKKAKQKGKQAADERRAAAWAEIEPVRMPHVDQTPKGLMGSEIDTGPGCPQIAAQVSSGKLFGGKVDVRLGFDWKTNTLWVKRSDKSTVSFVENATLIGDFKVMVQSGSGVSEDVHDIKHACTVLAQVVEHHGLPPFRPVVSFVKKKDADSVMKMLKQLLASLPS